MTDRKEILDDLVATVKAQSNGHNRDLDELDLSTIVKGAAIGAGAGLLYKALTKPVTPSSSVAAAMQYAKALAKAKSRKAMVSAAVGLLNVGGRILSATPELRDLGHRVIKVVQDTRLEDYFTEE